MASAPQRRVEKVGLQTSGRKADFEAAAVKALSLRELQSGKGHDGLPQREEAMHSLLTFPPKKGQAMSKGQWSGGLLGTLQEAPSMRSMQSAGGGSNQEGLGQVGVSQDTLPCVEREPEATQRGDVMEVGGSELAAPAAKREPLRSKRYVPPKQIDIDNLGEPSPASSTPSPSQTLKSPGPFQRTLADRSTAVLALPAAFPPGSQTESQRQLPTPRQAKKHASAIVTVPVPVPQVKKPLKPQAPNHAPRFVQPVIPPPSNRPHFPNKPEVAPPPVEKKMDARTLSLKIWMLEQLLKNDNADAGAVRSKWLYTHLFMLICLLSWESENLQPNQSFDSTCSPEDMGTCCQQFNTCIEKGYNHFVRQMMTWCLTSGPVPLSSEVDNITSIEEGSWFRIC